MDNDLQLLRLRKKKLGILLFDARIYSAKNPEECAKAIGISVEKYQEYENGQAAPSLAEIEGLANYLKIPLTHFWQSQSLSENGMEKNTINNDSLQIRNRIIGTLLRKDRIEAQLSLSDLAQMAFLDEEKLAQYEEGQLPIPIPELEMLLKVMDVSLQKYYDQNGAYG
jgi:transcriptional regulator with XRE-family HTH domain